LNDPRHDLNIYGMLPNGLCILFCRFAVNFSYAEAGVSADSKSNTIDVVADVKSERVCIYLILLII